MFPVQSLSFNEHALIEGHRRERADILPRMRSASPAPMGTPGIIHDASYVSDISVTAEELIIWRLSWSKTLAVHPCFSSPHPLPLHFQTLASFHLSRSPTTTLF